MTAAHGIQSYAWLLIALPALSAAVLLLLGRRVNKVAAAIGTLVPIALFVLTVITFFSVRSQDGEHREITRHLFDWVIVGSYHVDLGLRIDPLSLTFALLITGVGSLIHVYAIGYMSHDPGKRRFFGYFNLFVAAMLLLVLSDNYLSLYVGWEGVGVASYLLIGFYQDRPEAATAAKKAFLFNRVGDVGLSIAIMLMFAYFGTSSFDGVFGVVGNASTGVSLAIGLMLLLGACGKSGQFPLQGWLADAMAGPTPVSALIHAATMVTAGVYLIARSYPIFDHSQGARTVVLVVGAVTLLYGCIVGCAQDDLKRVLAYSTVSQIGYMFLAAGLGPGVYAIAILHLVGHGFFKAALFLSAGSVMHSMNDTIDMRRFGGLWRRMPVTYGVFVCGYLAIIGFPFATGFWTKDKIIESALDKGGTSGWILGVVALLGAGLTAFYMTRALIMTFHGKPRWEDVELNGRPVHPHESKPVMTVPMVVLAVLALAGGWLLVAGGALQNWLAPSVGGESIETGVHTVSKPVLTALTLVVVALGIGGAYLLFGRSGREVPAVAPARVSVVTTAARQRLYADHLNEALIQRPGEWLTRALVFFDNKGVDGLVNGAAAGFGGGSGRLRRLQTGFVRSYALTMLGGTVAVLATLLAVRFA